MSILTKIPGVLVATVNFFTIDLSVMVMVTQVSALKSLPI